MTMIMDSKSERTRLCALVTPKQITPTLSVIIPTLNEAQNIGKLLYHLHMTMQKAEITYEAIIVDDHSSDNTIAVAERTASAQNMPVRVLLKQGKPGKTYSLMEGMDIARHEAMATLDGDLQYPPESLPEMLDTLRRADIVVADRRATYRQASLSRGRFSHIFNVAIGRGLLALDTDVQSGMKVFRREVYDTSLLRPGPWSFDLELLTTAQQNGYRIANVPIEMHMREGGQSKVRVLRLAVELAMRAMAVRLHLATHTPEEDAVELAKQRPTSIPGINSSPDLVAEQVRAYERWLALDTADHAYTRAYQEAYAEEAHEIVTRGRSKQIFRPFAPHRAEFSAITTFRPGQIAVLVATISLWLMLLYRFGLSVVTATIGVVTALYLFDLGVTMMISLRTLQRHPVTPIDDQVARGIRNDYWPSYTILCPLYHEAEVASQFAQAMRLLDYPVDRLQVLMLTEEDDHETRDALLRMRLPQHFEVVTVPDGSPRTKPRACNYGLTIATGDFVVIFDAEDIPDPLQLKKAVLTFAQHDESLACAQASLTFYNPTQNLLTRWFTSEYSLWFGLTLPALQRMKTFLPLGGTSNHFRTHILREVGGWDPFNVTEDCDLGVRLAEYGYRTAMVDSTTYEEANPNVRNWLRQRSRWIKGYMQTYLVYMRNPWSYVRSGRLNELFWLQIIVGGRPLTQLINPVLWAMLLVYIVFNKWVTPIYHILYPAPIFYAAVLCLVFGNFFYVYSYLIGCLSRRQYLLTFWSLFIPIYWALMSVASYIALYQLITRPFYWEKTKHGLHLTKRTRWPLLSALSRGITPPPRKRSLTSPTAPRSHGWRVRSASSNQSSRRWVPLFVRATLDYIGHEVMVTRREISRSGRQHADLSPTITLPVAPVVDMFSTVSLPAILAKSTGHEHTRAMDQSTGYLVALRPVTPKITSHISRRRPSFVWLRDGWLLATLLTSIAASVAACIYYFIHGDTLIFSDAESHMRMARMPFDAVTTGMAQLGAGWLPMPHILMWPFITNDYLWSSGLAGAFVGMAAFVVAAFYTYRIAYLLTGSGAAAYVGTLVLVLNPNLLYLQSTPMSEPVLIAVIAATIFYVTLWTKTDQIQHLLLAAASALLANLTRYEGWTLFIALILIVVMVNAYKQRSVRRIIGEALLFATPGGFGIGMWVLWNYLVTGNPLFFENGPFSAQSQQAGFLRQGQLPTYHNITLVLLTYGADVLEFVGPVLVTLALVGAVLYTKRTWRRPEAIAALGLTAPLALYLVSLYSGQTVIYVPPISVHVANNLFNVRYATSALLPVAVFVATLVGNSRLLQVGAIALILGQAALTSAGGIIALQDGQHGLSCLRFSQSDIYLAEHYNGGRILDDIYVNSAAFDALDIHYSNVVNVGSYKIWQAALMNPGEYVDWVIVSPGDAVSKSLNVKSPQFASQFELVQVDASHDQIFHKRGLAPLPNRPAPIRLMQRYAQCNPEYVIPAASKASTIGAPTAREYRRVRWA